MIRPFCIAALTLLSTAHAQDLLPKAPPQQGPVILSNATIHTATGKVLLNGTIWFVDGKIGGVLPNGENPRLGRVDAEPVRIDLKGRHVFPGMISAHTSLGLVEIGQVPQSVDTNELGDMSPEAIAATAVNPDSAAIPVARSNGVLSVLTFPIGGTLPGRASLIQLDGWTNADMAIRRDAGPVVSWPSDSGGRFRFRRSPAAGNRPTVAQRRQAIDDAFASAKAWAEARANDPSVARDIRKEALVPALRGERPVFVLANSVEQIESAVMWGMSRGLKLVIVGGHEARACAELLKKHDVPVVIDGVHRLPRREDAAYDEPFTLPRDLHKAGVRFCIATGEDYSNDRNLPYHAATAMAFGLSANDTLAAVTRMPAEILGVGDRLGSLEKGKDATLFVASGSPFELTTKVELAWIQGRQIDLRNKQTELAKKYRGRYRQLEKK